MLSSEDRQNFVWLQNRHKVAAQLENRQRDRQTGRETDIQRDRGTDRQTERQIYRERQRDRQTERQRDRATDKRGKTDSHGLSYAHWKLKLKLELGVAFELSLWLAVAIGLAGCHRFTPFAAEPSNILRQLQLYLTGKQRTHTLTHSQREKERDAETI